MSPDSRREATVIFKLAVKASSAGVHRTLNRAPKGKGWMQCVNSPAGVMCRPEKVRENLQKVSLPMSRPQNSVLHGCSSR